ncbi:hypothetical protein J2Y45_005138 [Dyadobacter sp. BE34]|uniref:Transmembrane protein n=1 Tax=Dyadobacter fermentans TaxID=94254 RepID=A0ABU1R3L6_9BACT|nr:MULTISPECIES: hypothetical protein [Dyadobacter]MDR6807938.1 hypothetical protein [Dyadobacter fermentans]MDR7045679.1 hypothetical protein [Dyadobacter sp. BE242]MDR7199992.1 hypothetical protein [Dyadobacter sp. BE34]MDR7217549.1 hypothetical protein [Dyadobacter sp. BE31]MDR7265883.1 hypothetical protein [Dyadobacter sp. BE32]
MKTKLHLLAIFYRSFGFYLWAIPMIAWFALRRPTGRDLYVLIPALILFKCFLQGITIYVLRRRYAHLFFFYANANLSGRQLFTSAFITDFVLFALSMAAIQLSAD